MKRVLLFGLPFVAAPDHGQVVKEVLSWDPAAPMAGNLPLLSTPNVDQVVKLHRQENATLLSRVADAAYVLPDGQPLVWVSRWKKHARLPARLAGSDLFPALWKELAAGARPVFMVLPNEEVAAVLHAQNPAMRHIVPPFYGHADLAARDRLADSITAELLRFPVPLVFMGLGFPKQEWLALEVIKRLGEHRAPMPLFLLLGASFEFHTGMKKRAPVFWQKLGLEFMHRFLSEPTRMFRRYFVEDLAFFRLALREMRAR